MMYQDIATVQRAANPAEWYEPERWSSVRKNSFISSVGDSSERGGGMTASEDPSPPRWQLDTESPNRLFVEFSDFRDLGAGCFGSVQAATHELDGNRYAIKVLRKTVSSEQDLQRRLQEVYALSSCSSPHIVRYHDCWVNEDAILHVRTEYLSEGNVLVHQQVPWGEPQLWDLLRQTSTGVHAVHSAGIVHLDVKPDNMLCGRDDEQLFGYIYKLGDFGLARPIDNSSTGEKYPGLNDDEGDSRYLCPHFLRANNNVTAESLKQADTYSLGASVIHLAGGDLEGLKGQDYSSITGYSDELLGLLQAMTSPEPSDRPTAYQVIEVCSQALMQQVSANQDTDEEIAGYRDEVNQLRQELEMLAQEEAALESEFAHD